MPVQPPPPRPQSAAHNMTIRLLLPLTISLLLSGLASAAPVQLVTGDDYAPFTDRELPQGGMLTELVQQALLQAGHQPKLSWLPWKRGYQATLRGQFDATFPYLKTAEREADYLFSAPLYEITQRLFSRVDDALEPDKLEQLAGRRICVPLGWQPAPRVSELLAAGKLQVHQPQDLTACARLIDMGRDDFFIADSLLGERAIHLSGVSHQRFHVSRQAVGSHTLHFLVPRNRTDAQQLLDEFDGGLRRLRDSGEYQRILDAHREHALRAE